MQAEGDLQAAVELFQQAVPQAGTRVAPLANYALSFYLLGRIQDAIRTSRALMSRLQGHADTSSTMFGFPHTGLALAAAGQYRDALGAFREARQFGEEYQVLPFLSRAIAISAGVHLDLFDYATNEALNEEARDMAKSNNFPPVVVSAGIDLLLNFARRGDLQSWRKSPGGNQGGRPQNRELA